MKRIVFTLFMVISLALIFNCQQEYFTSVNNLEDSYPASEKMHTSRGTGSFLLNPDGWSNLYWMFRTSPSEWAIGNSSPYHTNADRWADDLWRYDGNTAGVLTYAAAAGTVIYAQTSDYVPQYGNQVVIQCDANPDFAIRYAHLATIAVKKDSHVNAGDLMDTVGNTGTQDYHLHFVLYKGINNSTNIRDLAEIGQTPQGGEIKAAYFNYNAGIPPVNSSNIYKWLGATSWTAPTGGTAISISVAANGNLWVVNGTGMLWKWNGYSWGNPIRVNDTVDVGCGVTGSIVITTGDRNSYGGQILKLVNGQWVEFAPGGRAVRVDVAHDGSIWVINNKGMVYKNVNGSWTLTKSSGGNDIGCGPVSPGIWITIQ